MTEQTTKPPTTAARLTALEQQVAALTDGVKGGAQTTDEQFSALEQRVAELEKTKTAQDGADPFVAIATLQGDIEEIKSGRPLDLDLSQFVKRDEIAGMLPPEPQGGKCQLCSCAEFRDGHASGNPELCMMCNHDLDTHQKVAA